MSNAFGMTAAVDGPYVISVCCQKGGVGKTTTAMMLAAALSRFFRVLLIDADEQGSATFWANNGGEELPFDFYPSVKLEELSQMRQLPYDVIIVDTPGSFADEPMLAAVLDVTDLAILPLNADPMTVPPLLHTLRKLILPRGIEHRVLLNNIDTRVQGEDEYLIDLCDEKLKLPRFDVLITRRKAITNSVVEGTVVTDYPDNRAHRHAISDYTTLKNEVLAIREAHLAKEAH